MPSDLSAYRRLYAALLALYPRSYRDRFGEGMEQTFNDLMGDRVRVGESVFLFVLGAFAETFVGIIKERVSFLSFLFMQKTFIRPLIIALAILVLPAIGELTVDDWDWGIGGFVLMGTMLYIAGVMFELIAKQSKSPFYKWGVGIGVVITFFLVWVNLAVGIIGDGNNMSASYFLAIPIGLVGMALSRLKPLGLSYMAFACAAWMLIVPCIALAIGNQDIQMEPGPLKVFILSAGFAFWYAVSGMLLRQSAGK